MAMLKIYMDENAAREHLESLNWPDGPVCPHCGTVNEATKLEGKSTRPGVYKCRPCREAMRDDKPEPMGGSGKIVESDETYIGRREGVPKPWKGGTAHKNVVLTLVERDGIARSSHIDSTSIPDIAPILCRNIRRVSKLMTDEARHYMEVGREYQTHDAVHHGKDEYVRYGAEVITTNTVEGYYSIFKRGMKGVYQHCSEKHLHRYLAVFDFLYSNRAKLGVNDAMHADKAMKGIVGKRLMYRRPRSVEIN